MYYTTTVITLYFAQIVWIMFSISSNLRNNNFILQVFSFLLLPLFSSFSHFFPSFDDSIIKHTQFWHHRTFIFQKRNHIVYRFLSNDMSRCSSNHHHDESSPMHNHYDELAYYRMYDPTNPDSPMFWTTRNPRTVGTCPLTWCHYGYGDNYPEPQLTDW